MFCARHNQWVDNKTVLFPLQTTCCSDSFLSSWLHQQVDTEAEASRKCGKENPRSICSIHRTEAGDLMSQNRSLKQNYLAASTVGFLLFISHSPNGLFCWLCTLCSLAINLKTRSIPGIFTTFHFESSMHVVLFLYTMEQLMQQAFSKLH